MSTKILQSFYDVYEPSNINSIFSSKRMFTAGLDDDDDIDDEDDIDDLDLDDEVEGADLDDEDVTDEDIDIDDELDIIDEDDEDDDDLL